MNWLRVGSYWWAMLLWCWNFGCKKISLVIFQGIPDITEVFAAFACFVSAFGTSDLLCRSPIIDPHRKSMGRATAWSEGVQVTAPVQTILMNLLRVQRCTSVLFDFVTYMYLSLWEVCKREGMIFLIYYQLYGSKSLLGNRQSFR
jgi:hypothetical protein